MKVSIIIVTMNRKKDLAICLDSIKRQTYKDYEVIVVDNGSTDGTHDLLIAENCIPIFNKENKGTSIARNQGINVSRGDLVWFLDDDSEILRRDRMDKMVRQFEEMPCLGSFGGEFYQIKNKLELREAIMLKNGETINQYLTEKELNRYDYIIPSYLPTCNCMIRKKLIKEIGGFDPGFTYFGDDKYIGYKIEKKNYRNMITKDSTVLHRVGKRTSGSNFYELHKARIRFALLCFNPIHILFLPLLDVYYLFELDKYKNFKRGNTLTKERSSGFIKTGFKYIFGIIGGYLWNLGHLLQTLKTRIEKPDYLK